MKVYELMNELSNMKSGAEVRINTVKTLDEMPAFDDDSESREVQFIVKEVLENDNYVDINGWAE